MAPPYDPAMSAAECARTYGVTRRTVERWRKSGTNPDAKQAVCTRTGTVLRITPRRKAIPASKPQALLKAATYNLHAAQKAASTDGITATELATLSALVEEAREMHALWQSALAADEGTQGA